jgi:hypothetical protein
VEFDIRPNATRKPIAVPKAIERMVMETVTQAPDRSAGNILSARAGKDSEFIFDTSQA